MRQRRDFLWPGSGPACAWLVVAGAVSMLVPFGWMVTTSLKALAEVFAAPLALPASPRWDNYVEAFRQVAFGRYFLVVLPLSGPPLATLAVFNFLGAWNDFMWPLIMTHSERLWMLNVGLSYFQEMYFTRGLRDRERGRKEGKNTDSQDWRIGFICWTE